LRKNCWNFKESQNVFLENILTQFDGENSLWMIQCTPHYLHDSEECVVILIKKMWEIVILKPELIETCGNFLKEIAAQQYKFTIELEEMVSKFMTDRSTTILSIPNDQFNDKIEQRLAQAAIFARHLYNRGMLSDESLEIWLQRENLEHLPTDVVAQLISLISEKVSNEGNISLRVRLMDLDAKVDEDLSNLAISIDNEMKEILEITGKSN
jgi:hypothetical protein